MGQAFFCGINLYFPVIEKQFHDQLFLFPVQIKFRLQWEALVGRLHGFR